MRVVLVPASVLQPGVHPASQRSRRIVAALAFFVFLALTDPQRTAGNIAYDLVLAVVGVALVLAYGALASRRQFRLLWRIQGLLSLVALGGLLTLSYLIPTRDRYGFGFLAVLLFGGYAITEARLTRRPWARQPKPVPRLRAGADAVLMAKQTERLTRIAFALLVVALAALLVFPLATALLSVAGFAAARRAYRTRASPSSRFALRSNAVVTFVGVVILIVFAALSARA